MVCADSRAGRVLFLICFGRSGYFFSVLRNKNNHRIVIPRKIKKYSKIYQVSLIFYCHLIDFGYFILGIC